MTIIFFCEIQNIVIFLLFCCYLGI